MNLGVLSVTVTVLSATAKKKSVRLACAFINLYEFWSVEAKFPSKGGHRIPILRKEFREKGCHRFQRYRRQTVALDSPSGVFPENYLQDVWESEEFV